MAIVLPAAAGRHNHGIVARLLRIGNLDLLLLQLLHGLSLQGPILDAGDGMVAAVGSQILQGDKLTVV